VGIHPLLVRTHKFPKGLVLASVLFPSLAHGQPVDLAQLVHNGLRPPFTLSFEVVIEDLRTRQQVDSELRFVIANNPKLWRQAGVSEPSIAQAITDLKENARHIGRRSLYKVTIRARGGLLSYVQEPLRSRTDKPGHPNRVFCVYSDKNTIIFRGDWVRIFGGFSSREVLFYPLPGVDFPFAPLFKRYYGTTAPTVDLAHQQYEASVPLKDYSSSEGFFKYSRGRVWLSKISNGWQVTRMVVPPFERPDETWQFSNHFLFKGAWIAKKTIWTRFFRVPGSTEAEGTGQLASRETYTLSKADPKEPDNRYFDLACNVPKRSLVIDTRPEQALRFLYDPELALDEQVNKAEQVRKPSATPALTILILMGASFIASVFLCWKARLKLRP